LKIGHPPSAYYVAEEFEERADDLDGLLSDYLEGSSEDSVHEVRTTMRRLMTFHRTLPKNVRNDRGVREYIELCQRFFRAYTSIRDDDIIKAKLEEVCGFREDDPLIVALVRRRGSTLAHARRLASELKNAKPPSIVVEEISNRKLKRRYRKLIDQLDGRLEKKLPQVLSDPKRLRELHEVRKQFKKLRYLVELSADKKKRAVAKALKGFTELQDLLGAIHDDDITIAYLRRSTQNEQTVGARNMLVRSRAANYRKLVEGHGAALLSRRWMLTGH